MEAPEKIYIVNDDLNIKREWYKTKQVGFETTEYTRTDAFIEKAVRWLKKELPITDLSPSNMLDIKFKVFDKECKKEFIEDFKNYMEGISYGVQNV